MSDHLTDSHEITSGDAVYRPSLLVFGLALLGWAAVFAMAFGIVAIAEFVLS